MPHEERTEEHHGNGHLLDELGLRETGEALASIDRELREIVRKQPVLAIGAAVAAGFVLGRILSR